MAKTHRKIGTGITARTITAHSGEDMGAFAKGFAARWNASISEGGGLFGARVVKAERAYREILRQAGAGQFEEDSLEDFAQQILRHINLVRAAISGGDADRAARLAVDVGRLCTEAEMKEGWESHALRGYKNAASLREVAQRENRKRKSAAEGRFKQWQAAADRIWAKNKTLSNSRVSQMVGKETGDKPDTIRRWIKGP